jgi:hypothetical protein
MEPGGLYVNNAEDCPTAEERPWKFGIPTDYRCFAQSPVPSNERLWRLVQPLAWWRIRLQLEMGTLFMKQDDL